MSVRTNMAQLIEEDCARVSGTTVQGAITQLCQPSGTTVQRAFVQLQSIPLIPMSSPYPIQGSQRHGADVNQIVDDGIDGETGRGMYLEFARYVTAVGADGIDGDEQVVGYLLV